MKLQKLFSCVLVSLLLIHPVSSFAAKKNIPPKAKGQKIIAPAWSIGLKTGKSKKKYFPESASILVTDERVFIGTHSGEIVALSARDGTRNWSFKSSAPIASQAASDGSQVYFGNNDGMVYALDLQTGEKKWEVFIGGEILSQPGLYRGQVIFVTSSREVYALDVDSGNLSWSTYVKGFEKKITIRGMAPVQIIGDKLYIGFADGQLACLSPGSGAILWSKTMDRSGSNYSDVDSQMIYQGGILYGVGYASGPFAIDASSGNILWQSELKNASGLALDDSYLYISTDDGRLVVLDCKKGSRYFDVHLYSGVLSSPVLFNDKIFVATETGKGYILAKENGEALQIVPIAGGIWGSPVFANGLLYTFSGSGKVKAFSVH